MVKIGLDKTINESLKVVKNETELPSVIDIQDFFGVKSAFSFEGSRNISLPIDNVGLAKLCYESALNTFYTTKVNEDGSIQRVFEPLPEGQHISDCLNDFSPEVLGWYKDRQNGNPLTLLKYPELYCVKPDLTKYEKYCDLENSKENVDRLETIDGAINCALNIYCSELLNHGVSKADVYHVRSEEKYSTLLALDNFYKQAKGERIVEEDNVIGFNNGDFSGSEEMSE